jgi:glyoxylase-like metal-dependent hydrolase (beta-lactamase superfamily II)
MSQFRCLIVTACGLALGVPNQSLADVVPGSLEVAWDDGAPDCSSADVPAIEVHAYESRTLILREGLCTTFEAPFLYLLLGSERALLIDTGAVADPNEAPIGRTVRDLIDADSPGLPLLVVHTHGHRDHRDGDAQFDAATVVSSELNEIKAYFEFDDWPLGAADLDLGGRRVVVLPAPGHHPAHLVFYDTRTGLLFAGDHLLPGRALISDWDDYRDTTRRLVEFVNRVEVTHVMGAHNELDQTGRGYWPGSTHHPNEGPLPLSAAHVRSLSNAVEDFNGFWAHHGDFVLVHVRNLGLAALSGAVVILAALVWGTRRAWRYRRR